MQTIVEIKALSNGAHNNLSTDTFDTIPEGWAIVPEGMETPNFPFGDIEVQEVTAYREEQVLKEVTRTRQIPEHDEDGNLLEVMRTEEYTDHEEVVEKVPYTYMEVTKWTPTDIPEPEPLPPSEQREEAYNTQAIIPWNGEMITVTNAAQMWQYYAAEGSSKAEELQSLIASAKKTIREQYPDKE